MYLFPKGGAFKYNFEKGKVWQNDNLYAPFDFPIQKTEKQLADEINSLKENLPSYFIIDTTIPVRSKINLKNSFNTTFSDTLNVELKEGIKTLLDKTIDDIYETGILSEDIYLDAQQDVVLRIKGGDAAKKILFSKLLTTEGVRLAIQNSFSDSIYKPYKNYLTSIFFNNIKENVRYDQGFNDAVFEQEKSKISPTVGLLKENAIIISKGEVIEGDKYQKLSSLKEIYESQVWNKSNYNWIVFGYVILVVLALLMLILFVKKYRVSIYNNNTKLTFIFFNIILMICITTVILQFQPNYLYIVPLCILPLILKAFFDARLGLFTHVITVLLIGFIVPNSYEYMFLQIIAGIITILTVSELYKRVNLFISVAQITMVYIIAYFSFFIIPCRREMCDECRGGVCW